MTRNLIVVWPDPEAFKGRAGASIRLLAVSDDVDHALAGDGIFRQKVPKPT